MNLGKKENKNSRQNNPYWYDFKYIYNFNNRVDLTEDEVINFRDIYFKGIVTGDSIGHKRACDNIEKRLEQNLIDFAG